MVREVSGVGESEEVGVGAAVGGGAVCDGVGAADVRAIDVGVGGGDSVAAATVLAIEVAMGRTVGVEVGGCPGTVDVEGSGDP